MKKPQSTELYCNPLVIVSKTAVKREFDMLYFKDIIGQEKAKAQLRQSVLQNRISHTQMFLGNSGYGGLPLAIAYARFVLCDNPGQEDSCGTCNTCNKIDKLVHPDLHFVFPVVRSQGMKEAPTSADYMPQWRKAVAETPYMDIMHWFSYAKGELKQGNISARDCNEVIRKFNMQAAENRYKILILWMPQYLQKSGNILLKLLEEPPEYSLFILVGTQESDVLPTIISRAQLMRMARLGDNEIKQALTEKYGAGEAEANEAVIAAEGDFFQALMSVQNKENESQHNFMQWFDLCRNMKKPGQSSKLQSLVKWVDAFAKVNREEQKVFLQTGLGYVRKLSGMTGESQSPGNSQLNVEQAEKLNELFNQYAYYIERNANSKILLFELSIKVNQLLNEQKVILN